MQPRMGGIIQANIPDKANNSNNQNQKYDLYR
jgi:hypothetical protein